MKNFLFENIWLLSTQEKKARAVKFHPKKNLITGMNHTGKSSLIKNLFLTLGARPQGKLERWNENTISVVEFSINQRKYRAVYQKGNRALFDASNSIIVASGNFREWSDVFAKITGFNLLLTDKELNTVSADPRCFFLPFYINQDGSWQSKWDTFTGLQQYKAPAGAILEYFTGIKPPKYYEINSSKSQSQKLLDELQKEKKLLNRARSRFDKSLSLSGPKLEAENFTVEIELLTSEVNALNEEQEKLKNASVKEQEMLHNIQLQINLATETISAYDKDVTFLRKSSSDPLLCPTCGAEHLNSFLDTLSYADDARNLKELVIQLRKDASKIELKHNETEIQLLGLESNYRRVSDILNTQKGDLKFSDVVNSIGAESAFSVFEEENAEIENEISTYVQEIYKFDEALKPLLDKQRSKDILTAFRNSYSSAIFNLNLPPTNTDKSKLTSRPDISGSGGPRSSLAYYAALWQACSSNYATFSIPLVIDSPNQQGQDNINLPIVLKFISNNLPKHSQIILGSEIDTEDEFDKRIHFDKPYSLLQEDEYESVESIVNPLLDLMHAKLQSNKY